MPTLAKSYDLLSLINRRLYNISLVVIIFHDFIRLNYISSLRSIWRESVTGDQNFRWLLYEYPTWGWLWLCPIFVLLPNNILFLSPCLARSFSRCIFRISFWMVLFLVQSEFLLWPKTRTWVISMFRIHRATITFILKNCVVKWGKQAFLNTRTWLHVQ